MTSVGVRGPAVIGVVVPGRLVRVVLPGRVRPRRGTLRGVELAAGSRSLCGRRRLAGLLGVVEAAEPLRFLAGHPLTFRDAGDLVRRSYPASAVGMRSGSRHGTAYGVGPPSRPSPAPVGSIAACRAECPVLQGRGGRPVGTSGPLRAVSLS